jgi:hypothetical protein
VEKEYTFDIAISLLGSDLGLARKIKTALQGYKVFLYTDEQERMGGTNGEVEFNKIFEEESKLVVILHRNNWGVDPKSFSSIEKTAIQNRASKQVYDDFCLLVSLEQSEKAEIPPFFPKRVIYYDYLYYGFDSLIAVIKNTFVRIGGEAKGIETAADIAKSIKRDSEHLQKKKELRFSTHGVELGIKEAEDLFTRLEKLAESIKGSVPNTFKRLNNDQISIYSSGYQINVSWWHHFKNDLDGNELLVTFRKRKNYFGSDLQVSKEMKFHFDFDYVMNPCWVKKGKEENFIYTEYLTEFLMKEFLSLFKERQKSAVRSRIL